MATGIEMLGQMGTDQSLAGPVQGGNMVVKPNQVPVGGAAMLSKALRGQADKGVGGMYVLPEQQDQTPDFMKMAQMSVEKEMANQRNQYPNNFAEEEGGIIPMLPRNLKTRPGAPETTLAYITPEEQAVLGLLNPGTPHRGPEDVPSYDEGDYLEDIGYSRQEVQRQQERAPTIDTSTRQGQQQRQAFRDRTGSDVVTDRELEGRGIERDSSEFEKLIAAPDAGTTTETVTEVSESQSNDLKNLAEHIKNDNKEEAQKIIKKNKDDMNFFQTLKTMYSDTLGAGINKVAEWGSGLFSDKDKDGKDTKKGDRTKKFISNLFGGPSALLMSGVGKMLEDFKVTPEKLRDENYLAIMKDVFKKDPGRQKEFEDKYSGMIADVYGEGEEGEGFSAALASAVAPEGSEAQRRTNPEAYYTKPERDPEGGFFQPVSSRFANTIGNLENIAGIDASAPGLTPAFRQRIFDAREEVDRQKYDQGIGDRRPGVMGGGAGPVIEDEVTEAVVEEGATTMPYTGPRTGGAEVNVPLSRRFALDPTQDVAQYRTAPRSTEDIYKYYTEGTEGEGLSLEPYSEFQKRRRKALGREPLDFWSY